MIRRFSHRCRNALNGIKMGLYLFKREAQGGAPECLAELARIYEEIERAFDRLQLIYRPLPVTMVRSSLGLLIIERLPAWRSCLSDHGRTLEIDRPNHDDTGDFDPTYLDLSLDTFIRCRAEAGQTGSHARLSWRVRDGCFEIAWHETCPPPCSGDHRHDFPASHGQRPSGCVHSLALPLLARVAAAHGGYLATTSGPSLSVTIRWPQFANNPVPA
jgi:hypothetical protein